MTGFTRSPRVQKGAIIGVDPANPLASVIVFQYNPEKLTRTVTAQTAGAESAQGEAMRLKGPPREQVSLAVEIDATDQLAASDAQARAIGIHGQLAALEMLLYPKSALVIANEVLKAVGMLEVIPPTAPLVLFVWGHKRVLPVRLSSFSITEEAFDPDLNPIRATVDLSLDVLTYADLGVVSAGGALHLAHQITKEVMATLNSAGTLGAGISFSL
ncbi:MAG: hypothetical protein KDC98_26595 [Planctomycetes bacterium]|nr:hypothetical protein [Planctomycetota bacterium]